MDSRGMDSGGMHLQAADGGADEPWRVPLVRNIVQLNPAADALGFAAAAIGRTARTLRLNELGRDVVTAELHAPSGTGLRPLLPLPIAYGRDIAALAAVLAQLRPARLMVAHRLRAVNLFGPLLRMAAADAVCLAEDVAATRADESDLIRAIAHADLAPFDPGLDLAALGLSGLRLFANAAGGAALATALAALDEAWQHRRRNPLCIYDVNDLALVSGFHDIEHDQFWRWCWTGPDTIATFLAPMHGGRRNLVTLFLFAAKRPVDARHLRILVNGRAAPARYYESELKIELELTGLAEAPFARFDLVQRETVPTEDHSRRLGFALHKLKIEVGTAGAS